MPPRIPAQTLDPNEQPDGQPLPPAPEEVAAEPSEDSPDETVDGVTAAEAAVESYKRNNPEGE